MTAPTRTPVARVSPSSLVPRRDASKAWRAWVSGTDSESPPHIAKLNARIIRPAAVPSLLIRGGTIVDARGERSGDILLRDGRIVEVGDVHTATDEPVLAANGQYVTPGLIDCHIHLCYQAGPDPRVITGKTDVRLGAEAAEGARKTLRAGVTTARDCGGRGFVETY